MKEILLLCRAFPTILGKGPWPKLGKMINLTSKFGEINDIEHNKGSKIYPQNQVILDCIMPSIPLKGLLNSYQQTSSLMGHRLIKGQTCFIL